MTRATVRQVLRACFDYWQADDCEPAERTVCYAWVESRCRHLFGTTFPPSLLDRLAERGHLVRVASPSGEDPPFYALRSPERMAALAPARRPRATILA